MIETASVHVGSYYYADDYEDENRQRANDHMHRYVGEFMNGKFNGKGLSVIYLCLCL
jgi:hypothetical protein